MPSRIFARAWHLGPGEHITVHADGLGEVRFVDVGLGQLREGGLVAVLHLGRRVRALRDETHVHGHGDLALAVAELRAKVAYTRAKETELESDLRRRDSEAEANENDLRVGLVGLLFHSMMYAPQAAFFSELFGTSVRYTGASVGYQLASIFARWVIPEAGFEVYGEWARDDTPYNLMDMVREPDWKGVAMADVRVSNQQETDDGHQAGLHRLLSNRRLN